MSRFLSIYFLPALSLVFLTTFFSGCKTTKKPSDPISNSSKNNQTTDSQAKPFTDNLECIGESPADSQNPSLAGRFVANFSGQRGVLTWTPTKDPGTDNLYDLSCSSVDKTLETTCRSDVGEVAKENEVHPEIWSLTLTKSEAAVKIKVLGALKSSSVSPEFIPVLEAVSCKAIL